MLRSDKVSRMHPGLMGEGPLLCWRAACILRPGLMRHPHVGEMFESRLYKEYESWMEPRLLTEQAEADSPY